MKAIKKLIEERMKRLEMEEELTTKQLAEYLIKDAMRHNFKASVVGFQLGEWDVELIVSRVKNFAISAF